MLNCMDYFAGHCRYFYFVFQFKRDQSFFVELDTFTLEKSVHSYLSSQSYFTYTKTDMVDVNSILHPALSRLARLQKWQQLYVGSWTAWNSWIFFGRVCLLISLSLAADIELLPFPQSGYWLNFETFAHGILFSWWSSCKCWSFT